MLEQRRFSRDVLGILGTRGVWSAMGIVSGVILARQLGPHDRGILALVLLLPSTVLTLVKLGISQSNVYFVNREKVGPDRVASNSAALALSLGTLAAVLVWLGRGPLHASVLRGVPDWALALGLVRVPLLLLDDYLYGVLQATGLFRIYNVRLLFGETLRLVLVVLFLVVFDGGLVAAVSIYTFVTVVNVAWLVSQIRKRVPFGLRFERALLSEQLRFGLKSYVQTLTQHLLLRIDIYMVAYFLSPSETAFYALALRFTEMVLEIPQAVGLVLYPRLAASSPSEIHRLTAQACRRTLLVSGVAALALALVGPPVITLWYGRPYAPAGAPLPWAAVGVLAISIFVIVTRAFTSQGRQEVNIAAGVLALAGNVVLNAFLIPAYGIVGAAFATAVSYTAACVLLLAFYRRESQFGFREVFLANREDLRFFWRLVSGVLQRAALLPGSRSAR
ncbi:MAG: hypothetical protein KatS3mg076_2460 [Candidatus Binatia bacterium]|nr:MAG: hypothetical protein KatS3mg076_2460 [Candidatus Binatia bacterium]